MSSPIRLTGSDGTQPDICDVSDLQRGLKIFARPSNARALRCIAGNWLIIIACGVLWHMVLGSLNTPSRVLVSIVEVIVLTSRIRALESLTHEASHGTLFRTRSLNTRLQWLYALPILHEVRAYGAGHILHHRYLGSEGDPAQKLFRRHRVNEFPAGYAWVMFIRPCLGYHTLDWAREKLEWWTDLRSFRIVAPFWMAILVIGLMAGWLPWLLLHWFVALALLFPIVEFWGEVADHASVDPMALGKTRSNVGLLHRLILHTHADGYHMVHHISPSIPGHRLRAAHAFARQAMPFARILECYTIGETLAQLRATANASRIIRSYPRGLARETVTSLRPSRIRRHPCRSCIRKRMGPTYKQTDKRCPRRTSRRTRHENNGQYRLGRVVLRPRESD